MKIQSPLLLFYPAILSFIIGCSTQPDAVVVKKVDELMAGAQHLSTDPDQAVALTQQALDVSIAHRYTKGEATCYNWLGVLNQRQNRYLLAEDVLIKALAIRKKAGEKRPVADVYNNFANLRRSEGKTKEAVAYADSAMTLYKAVEDSNGILKVYLSLAEIMRESNYDTAHFYNLQAVSMIGPAIDKQKELQAYFGLAQSFHTMAFKDSIHAAVNAKEALQYHKKALTLSEALNDSRGIALSKGAISIHYWEQDKMDSFYLMQNEVETLYLKLRDSTNLFIHYFNRGLADQESDPKNALKLFGKAADHLIGLNRPGEYRDLYNDVALTWEIMGKPDSALHYYKIASEWNTKAQKLNEKNQQEAILAQMGHYDRGLELQKTKRSNTILVISLIALALLLATIIQAFLAIRRKKRHEDLLYKQKIDEMVLRQETENVLAVAAGESKAREATAQHLHDGVGSVLIALQWEVEAIAKEHNGDERAIRALETVKIAYQEVKKSVNTLRRNRMDWLTNLQKFCEVVSKSQKIAAKVLCFGLDDTIAPEIGEEARLIAQELVANALKHSGADVLTVQINRVGSELNISIEDNGKGFDPAEVLRGDGLKNLAARIAKLNGVFDIDSNKGAGTTIFVTIPVEGAK